MAITLYNTRTRRKEALQPIDPSNVRMYVCGPTVYDRAHIGNARPVVVFDVLYRLLRHEYGVENVKYARNFTDVDDKINAKAAETGRSIRDITNETIAWYHEDMDALGALRPDFEPRATEYIAQMVAMIDGLIASGHAYEAEGHVLFAVSTDPDYGSLSRRSLDEMRAGARVEVAPYKRDPMDFVLWKPSTGEQPGWDSPWGRGRPGWHIECSAMAGELFGDRFDIHGGGIDLQFPHHENECAQSRCAGHDFANVWMHNGYLMVEGEKMSKSLGNFFTVADLRAKGVPGEVMRLAMLMTHYRKPIDWTQRRLDEAKVLIERLMSVVMAAPHVLDHVEAKTGVPDVSIVQKLEEDLDTRGAIDALIKLAEGFDPNSPSRDEHIKKVALNALFLGFDFKEILELRDVKKDIYSACVELVLKKRAAAKEAKDFAKADSIRDQLTDAGVEIKDTSKGVEWSLTPSFDPEKLPEISDA